MICGDPSLISNPEYRQLVDNLRAGYDIETITVRFDECHFYFTRVRNAGDVPLDLDQQGQLRWQPYWAEDWESSRALCRLLLATDLENRTVLDLGCGLGLTGAVAASMGAQVTLADNAEPALDFSRVNCWQWRDRCQFQLVDWQRPNPDLGAFDFIVGAEIIYDAADWEALESFWRRHLGPSGKVLLCDPFRRTGKEFRVWIQQKNWRPSFSDMRIPEFDQPVNVIELSR